MSKSKIIIVGLGPGNPGDLTAMALQVLSSASTIYLRTAKHPTVPGLPAGPQQISFDDIYDKCPTFNEVYDTIVGQLIEMAESGSAGEAVVYAVPGHPLVGEASVLKLLKRAKAAGLKTEIVSGLSFIETVCASLEIDPLEQGMTILDATELAEQADIALPREKGFSLPSLRPLLISQIYNQRLAGGVKLALMENYPDEHPVTLLRGAGIPGEEGRLDIPLYELDRHPEWTDHLTCAYLPPLPILQTNGAFEQIQYVMARLRGPEGCPWDKEQTHHSLKRYLLEETYEVLHAIEEEPEKLHDELGDLLLQVLFHSQIAAENGDFDISDVIEAISAKMIRRHPHVFAGRKVSGAEEVTLNWEQIKQAERAAQGQNSVSSKEKEPPSVLDSVPKEMPALLQAQHLQRKAAGIGFEWHNFEEILDKLVEEIREVKEAPDHENLTEEIGDVLAVLVNAARWLKVDAEEALRRVNNKFRLRFRYWEQIVQERQLDPTKMSLPELIQIWEEAKEQVGSRK